MITTLRILKAARKCDSNLIKLCWHWKAEDPGIGQKKIDPVSCIRIQVKSLLFSLILTLGYFLIAAIFLLPEGLLGLPLALGYLLFCVALFSFVDRVLLKNNWWVFNNAWQFVFAVAFAERARGQTFVVWDYDQCEGFSGVKNVVLVRLKRMASDLARLQRIPFKARKAARMKSEWSLYKTLLRQLFPELPEHDGEYFSPKTESGNN